MTKVDLTNELNSMEEKVKSLGKKTEVLESENNVVQQRNQLLIDVLLQNVES